MPTDYKVILFDLGGVLLELGEYPLKPDWFRGKIDFAAQDWFHSDVAIAFEQGRLSAEEFAQTMINTLALDVSSEALLAHFAHWISGLYPQVDETLAALKSDFILAFLSNTNEVHWPRIISEFGFEQHFTHMFASHHLQLSKPNPAIFQVVLQTMNVQAHEVLFYDDNPTNISTAHTLGIDAVHVKGFNAVLDDLNRRQLIKKEAL